MKRYLASALFLTMILNLGAAPSAWSKPSDLPADQQIQCPECGEEKTGTPSLPLAEPSPTTIDPMLPAYIEQALKLATGLLARQQDALDPARLFQQAESYVRSGNLRSARLIYQRVHMLTPTTMLGRLAIDRLTALEERMRDASESSEMPESADPRQSFRRIREGSVPLGLVEVSY